MCSLRVFICLLVLLLSVVLCRAEKKIQLEKLCSDPDCSEPISLGRAQILYIANIEGYLSCKKGAVFEIMSKPKRPDMKWGYYEVRTTGKKPKTGRIPTSVVRETNVLTSKTVIVLTAEGQALHDEELERQKAEEVVVTPTQYPGNGVAAEAGNGGDPSTPHTVVDNTTFGLGLDGIETIVTTPTQEPVLNTEISTPIQTPSAEDVKTSEEVLEESGEEYEEVEEEEEESEEGEEDEEPVPEPKTPQVQPELPSVEPKVAPAEIQPTPTVNVAKVTSNVVKSEFDTLLELAIDGEPGKSKEYDELILKKYGNGGSFYKPQAMLQKRAGSPTNVPAVEPTAPVLPHLVKREIPESSTSSTEQISSPAEGEPTPADVQTTGDPPPEKAQQEPAPAPSSEPELNLPSQTAPEEKTPPTVEEQNSPPSSEDQPSSIENEASPSPDVAAPEEHILDSLPANETLSDTPPTQNEEYLAPLPQAEQIPPIAAAPSTLLPTEPENDTISEVPDSTEDLNIISDDLSASPTQAQNSFFALPAADLQPEKQQNAAPPVAAADTPSYNSNPSASLPVYHYPPDDSGPPVATAGPSSQNSDTTASLPAPDHSPDRPTTAPNADLYSTPIVVPNSKPDLYAPKNSNPDPYASPNSAPNSNPDPYALPNSAPNSNPDLNALPNSAPNSNPYAATTEAPDLVSDPIPATETPDLNTFAPPTNSNPVADSSSSYPPIASPSINPDPRLSLPTFADTQDPRLSLPTFADTQDPRLSLPTFADTPDPRLSLPTFAETPPPPRPIYPGLFSDSQRAPASSGDVPVPEEAVATQPENGNLQLPSTSSGLKGVGTAEPTATQPGEAFQQFPPVSEGVGTVEPISTQPEGVETVEEVTTEPEEPSGPGFFEGLYSSLFGSETPPSQPLHVPDAVPSGECKTLDELQTDCADAPSPPHLWNLFDRTVPETSYSFLYLVITSVTVLIFTLGYYFIERTRQDGPLIAKVNKLTHELQVAKSQIETQASHDSLILTETNGEALAVLQTEINDLKRTKKEMESQLESLQQELDAATEAGLEMNKMLTDVLSQQQDSGPLMTSVVQLQGQLDVQQKEIDRVNLALKEKIQENSELQSELTAALEKVDAITDELNELRQSLNQQIRDKEDLTLELEEKIKEVAASKDAEVTSLTKTIAELSAKADIRDGEFKALSETIEELKSQSSASIDSKKILDIGHSKAALARSQAEKDALQERLKDEEGARKLLELHVKTVDEEVSRLRTSFEEAEKAKLEAETRLNVLSNYFKEKETQLQKELGLQEAILVQKEGNETNVYERIKLLQEEVESYNSLDSLPKCNETVSSFRSDYLATPTLPSLGSSGKLGADWSLASLVSNCQLDSLPNIPLPPKYVSEDLLIDVSAEVATLPPFFENKIELKQNEDYPCLGTRGSTEEVCVDPWFSPTFEPTSDLWSKDNDSNVTNSELLMKNDGFDEFSTDKETNLLINDLSMQINNQEIVDCLTDIPSIGDAKDKELTEVSEKSLFPPILEPTIEQFWMEENVVTASPVDGGNFFEPTNDLLSPMENDCIGIESNGALSPAIIETPDFPPIFESPNDPMWPKETDIPCLPRISFEQSTPLINESSNAVTEVSAAKRNSPPIFKSRNDPSWQRPNTSPRKSLQKTATISDSQWLKDFPRVAPRKSASKDESHEETKDFPYLSPRETPKVKEPITDLPLIPIPKQEEANHSSLPTIPTPKPRFCIRRKSSVDFEAKLERVQNMMTAETAPTKNLPEDLVQLQELKTVRASPFIQPEAEKLESVPKCSQLVEKFESIMKPVQALSAFKDFPKKGEVKRMVTFKDSFPYSNARKNFEPDLETRRNFEPDLETRRNFEPVSETRRNFEPFSETRRKFEPIRDPNCLETDIDAIEDNSLVPVSCSPELDKSESEDLSKEEVESSATLEFDIKVVANASKNVKKYKKKVVRQKTGAQNEILKKEITNQECELKTQIASLEKKARENWVAARQVERRLEESKQEASQLRNMLTLMDKSAPGADPAKPGGPSSLPGELNGDEVIPPILAHGNSPLPLPPLPLDFLAGPPPMLPPGPFPPFTPPLPGNFLPPMPPFHPSRDRRPPPLGRMSSPPLNCFSPPPPPDMGFPPRGSPPPMSPPGRNYRGRTPPFPEDLPPRSSFRPVASHRDTRRDVQGSNSGHSSSPPPEKHKRRGRV